MADQSPTPRTIDRVVASYNGVPCTKVRPADAPVRPGEPCGEIHTCCRGHSTGSVDPQRRGDPCQRPALTGLEVCANHGGTLPEPRAKHRDALAQRAVGQLVGTTGPVDDPVRVMGEVLGEMRAWRDATRELVAMIQAGGPSGVGDEHELLIEAGGKWVVHPIVKMAEAADERLFSALAVAAKLGIEERLAKLEEDQLDLTVAVLRKVFIDAGMDPDDALGRFAVAARDLEALPGTVGETIEAHVVRTMDVDAP